MITGSLVINFNPIFNLHSVFVMSKRQANPLLRWHKGDKDSFYYYTGQNLVPLINVVDNMLSAYEAGSVSADRVYDCIESTYTAILSILRTAGYTFIPSCHKNFFKFWWDEDLSSLTEASVDSDKMWKYAGKPRSGPIFSKRQSCRLQYRQRLRQAQRLSLIHIWRCRRSTLCRSRWSPYH